MNDQLQATPASQPAREELQQLIESFAQAHWETDVAGRVIKDSPSWRAYTGQTIEQWLGEGWLGAIHPDDRARALSQWQQAIQTQTPVNAEFRFQSPDGGWRWTNVRATAILDPDGSVRKWVGLNIDITGKRQAEEVRDHSEERFRAFMMATSDVVYRMSADWRQMHQLVGKSFLLDTSATSGSWLEQYIPPFDQTQVQAAIDEAIAGKKPFRLEHRVVQADGSLGWTFSRAIPLLNEQGEITEWFGTASDITARKQQEEKQAYLLQLSDALRPLTDPTAIQATAARLLGEHLGTDRAYYAEIREATSEFVVAQYWPQPGSPIHTRRYPLGDWPMPWLTNGQTWVVRDTTSDPAMPDDQRADYLDNDIGATVVVPLIKQGRLMATFVTNQRAPRPWTPAEVSQVEETAERTWAALERARAEEALKVADQRKDEFLAMLAHELRNPMATVRNGLTILRLLNQADSETDQLVARMDTQVDHLVYMIDDLLDVSRISRGKIGLHKERVNLVDAIRQAIEAVGTMYKQAGHTLTVNLPTAGIELEGDATRLTQVVSNLLTNAARYTPPGGQVTVCLEHSGQEALLRVRDTGIGLTADQRDSIFELFVQGDNSLARAQGGLGLGLTLVKRLVELHGGRVEAQSEGLGKGSEFRVWLPTLTVASIPEPVPKLQPAATASAIQLVVIDDNADAAFTLSMLLKLMGYKVHTRYDGRQGIQVAEELRPRIILCDIGMPELDGYETCRLIRQQVWGLQTILIALTGYGSDEDKQRAREAGFDGHIVKPVNLAELQNLLTSLLATSETEGSRL